MEVGKNWIYLCNVTLRWKMNIWHNNRSCWEYWPTWYVTIDRRASGTCIKTIALSQEDNVTVRSTAGLIRYLVLQFGSTTKLSFSSSKDYSKFSLRILIFDGNETSLENFTKIGNSTNLKIHLLFKVNFLRTQKILSYFFDLLFHIELLYYQLRNRFRSKP